MEERALEDFEKSDGALRTIKDLGAGAAGGIAQVLLDIVKVRLQTTTQYAGALDCASKILKNEGPAAFYKGTLTPLIGIGACVSVQFGAFHEARRRLEELNKKKYADSSLSYGQYYMAGGFAGLTNSVLSGPIEHIRIRMQTQPHGADRLYNGPIDCIRKLSAQGGVLRGLYRGQNVTYLREIQAYGMWFLTFEFLMNQDAKRNNVKREDISSLKVATYGGLAGEALWLSSYPFDVVKSKMQCDGFGAQQQFKSMTDCFKKTYAAEGLAGFWKGIGPTLLRAMPVSAGTFVVVELAMKAMGRQLHSFSRQARTLNSLNRFYSTEPPVDTTLQTRIKERSAEIESRYQNDAVPERISRRRAEQLAWKARGERRYKFQDLGSSVTDAYKPEDIIRNPPKPSDVTLELLLASQTHLGHSTSRWNPQNSRYIFGIRDGVHVISLDVTAAYLRRAAKVVEEVAARGGLILFVGTRKGQKRYVVRAAELAKGYHIFERWIPGSLTNGQQILGHCDTKVVNAMDNEIPKFREALADRSVLKPDLVVCLNPLENVVLLHECGLNNVPTIGVIDTDADPTRVTYPIPSNDDSMRAIGVIAGVLGRAGEAGQQRRLENAKNGVLTYPPLNPEHLLSPERLAELAQIEAANAAANAETAELANKVDDAVKSIETEQASIPKESSQPAEPQPEQPKTQAQAPETPVKDQ
ncbi:mitochondrial carrier domain-containing protein [Aspergillus caelatus]|uniref:Mitochondrial carrier domain-containing protein n=1 Tax=Aspergillus caelatus TaxID=61420 RepID=A0A5N7A6B4_9EURO|nr:mitochondrial carrier domain-containing protein [Aspergillus caelatus]KAE8364070.1 mitochondrial carrier domain-containing protein [Aspergillus caelatus]